jgi:MFS family permease
MLPLANRWAILALLFCIGLCLPMQFQQVLALAPFLAAEGVLSYGEIGLLTGLFMLPGVILAGPSTLLANRIGDRLTLAAGVLLMSAASVMFVLTDNYTIMAASRLIGGAGGMVITVFLPKATTDWFAGRELATAQSVMASSFGLGLGIAIALLPSLASIFDWRTATLINAGFGVAATVVLLLFYRDHEHGGRRPASAAEPRRINRPEITLTALAGLARGLFSTGYIVFMSFTPPLLIYQGMAAAKAGLLTSIAAALSIASVPLGGYLTDRTGKPNWFIAGGAIGAAAACVLTPYFAPAVLWIVLFGILRGGCTGGIMAMPGQVLRPESRRAGFAVASSAYFVCMAVFPAIAGYLLETTDAPAVPLWFAGALWLAILAQLATFRALQHRWIG